MIFIREGLIAKILYAHEDSTSENTCLDVLISKKKWCITFTYRPPYNSKKDSFFKELNQSLWVTFQENMKMSFLLEISM